MYSIHCIQHKRDKHLIVLYDYDKNAEIEYECVYVIVCVYELNTEYRMKSYFIKFS